MGRRSLEEVVALDREDPLQEKRAAFAIPDGVIYLDGNSLGLLPQAVSGHLAEVVTHQWGESLIRAWNRHDWIDLPRRVGDKIARLIGAEPGTVVVTDSTSVNLFKVLAAALTLRPERRVVLSEEGNFPTDLYIAEGLCELLGGGSELRLVTADQVEPAIDEEVAVVMLTQVDYRTGRKHDMGRLTRCAHEAGALVVWDLAHSVGAFPVDLAGADADFAVGCGYKYLNGGPGAPAFLYVALRHQPRVTPALAGWMGHAAPFAFETHYRPASGIDRMRVGTPPVLSLAALDCALDVFADVDLAALQAKSVSLCELFITEVEARCPDLALVSPRDTGRRGSQVSFRCAYGYPLMQALIERGVIGDFRSPDTVRFGFAPLYLSHVEVMRAAGILEETVATRAWDRPEYLKQARVT